MELLEKGTSFNKAADALNKLEAVISGGAHIDFAKKNSWIANPAQRTAYLTSGIDQGIADKQFIIDFYKLVVGTQELRAAFTKFLASCRLNNLYFVYMAYCYEYKMKQLVTFDELDDISSAFVEFDSIYNTYNNGDIYKSFPAGKSQYTDREYYMMVLDHMNTAIGKKSHLKKFMEDATTISYAVLNKFYVIDRETKELYFLKMGTG